MGKVIKSFNSGFSGAVSRSVDDVVIPMGVQDTNGIAFGRPVVLSTDGKSIRGWQADSVAADLVGFTVRSASKTPETYGSNTAGYKYGEMADVLVRGSMTVPVWAGDAVPGGRAYVMKENGYLSAAADADTGVELPNVRFRGEKDVYGVAEIVVLERSLQ